ncbi:MAG: hypothetical protein IPM63_17940 [Acidobacteriota bacterium]|nr:MAG: hypothetical protein IPM63_17940 [Acidobacteriota bacterium]
MRKLLIALVFACTASLVAGQDRAVGEVSDAQLFDEIGPTVCDDLITRLDQFSKKLTDSEDAFGTIVVSAGTDEPIRVLRLRPMVFNYLVNESGVNPARFKILRSGPTKQWRISLWLSPNPAFRPEITEPEYDFSLPSGIGPLIAFGEEGHMCPPSGFNNSGEFEELLQANPQARGHIVIKAPSRGEFEKEKLRIKGLLPAINNLRLRFFYVKDDLADLDFLRMWTEYWIVPKKEQ